MDKQKRKLIRHEANMQLGRHYLIKVIVTFMVALLVGGFSYATTTNVNRGNLYMGYSLFGPVEQIMEGLDADVYSSADDDTSAYTKGVLAVFVNQFSKSNSIIVGTVNALNILIFKEHMEIVIVIASALVIAILLGIFFNNILIVGQARFFLEQRCYSKNNFRALFVVYRYGFTKRVALTMFLKTLFQALWNITVIGGIIKYYEYSMIPYILAENPSLGYKEVFRRSKELTKGFKFQIFLMDMSVLPFRILSLFTYNIPEVLYVKPYVACMYAEIYSYVRGNAPETCVYALNDHALFSPITVSGTYNDKDFPHPLVRKYYLNIDYRRDYSLLTYILMFFSFAMIGWVWEVFYTMIYIGVIVNRGTMAGPWVPIYGVGGVLITMLLKPVREEPVKVFALSSLIAGVVEYFAGWILEVMFNMRWWNYEGFFLNINGRICLEGLLAFGIIGSSFVYIVSPLLDDLLSRVSTKKKMIIAIILVTIFAVDFVYSIMNPNVGIGITTM